MINFPPTFAVESLPPGDKINFEKFAVYVMSTESTPTSVTFRREFDLGESLYLPAEYPGLRSFYNKFETKDQENVVLKVAGTEKPGTPGN